MPFASPWEHRETKEGKEASESWTILTIEATDLVSVRKPRFLSGAATLAARQMPDPQGFELVESHGAPD